MIKNTIMPAG